MANTKLVTEIRNEIRHYVDGGWTLSEFRRWFVGADRRAHRGAPSGQADREAVAITDEIMTALVDLDDGLIAIDELPQILSRIGSVPRGDVLLESHDTSARRSYARPALVLDLVTNVVPV